MNQNKNNFSSQQKKIQRHKKQNVLTDHTDIKTEGHTDSFAN